VYRLCFSRLLLIAARSAGWSHSPWSDYCAVKRSIQRQGREAWLRDFVFYWQRFKAGCDDANS
jgi:hypothetical protein